MIGVGLLRTSIVQASNVGTAQHSIAKLLLHCLT
jgi:hypothetical protein